MLRDPNLSPYRATNVDKRHSSLKLTIMPVWCEEFFYNRYWTWYYFCNFINFSKRTIPIAYKLRDAFHFNVGAGLTLKYLDFNAIDSAIHPSDQTASCLSQF